MIADIWTPMWKLPVLAVLLLCSCAGLGAIVGAAVEASRALDEEHAAEERAQAAELAAEVARSQRLSAYVASFGVLDSNDDAAFYSFINNGMRSAYTDANGNHWTSVSLGKSRDEAITFSTGGVDWPTPPSLVIGPHAVATINPDGHVTLGKHVTPNRAARAFWRAVEASNPLRGEVARLRAELASCHADNVDGGAR